VKEIITASRPDIHTSPSAAVQKTNTAFEMFV